MHICNDPICWQLFINKSYHYSACLNRYVLFIDNQNYLPLLEGSTLPNHKTLVKVLPLIILGSWHDISHIKCPNTKGDKNTMERPTELEKAILKHGLSVFTSKPNSKAHVQRINEAHKNFRVGLLRGWTRNESIRYALSITAKGEGYKYRTAKYQEALKASSLGDITSISQLVDWTRRATTHKDYIEVKIVCNKPPLMLLWQRAVKAVLGDRPPTSSEY